MPTDVTRNAAQNTLHQNTIRYDTRCYCNVQSKADMSRLNLPHGTTHTHPFNGPFSGTTQVSRYQKGKTIWILLKQEIVSGSGISWAICKSAPRSKQITMPTRPFCRLTNSVKALKARNQQLKCGNTEKNYPVRVWRAFLRIKGTDRVKRCGWGF